MSFKKNKKHNYHEKKEKENQLAKPLKVTSIHEAESYMKGNRYILRGYRMNFDTWKRVVRSFFMIHNESINVWTHFFGALLVIFLVFYTIFYFQINKEFIHNFNFDKFKSEFHHLTDPVMPK